MSSSSKKAILEWLFVGVIMVLLSVPLWLKVDQLPIRLWDEAQNAVNALEVSQTHNWLVRTYDYQPDTFDCKPPLLIWFQVLSIKALGLTELSIRLPSVVFSVLSCFVLFALIYTMTDKKWPGILAVLITVTSVGFYGEHAGRYGDHEALLILLILVFLYYLYCYSVSLQNNYLYAMGVTIALGILCKSIAILLILPGAITYLWYCKSLGGLFKNKHLYSATLMVLVIVASYYLGRTYYQPDYLYTVWHGELLPRFTNTSETHHFRYISFWFYFELLYKETFVLWSFLVPFTLLIPVMKRKLTKKWFFWFVSGLTLLLFLSAGTKHYWYIAPLVPLFAGLIAISIYYLFEKSNMLGLILLVPVLLMGFSRYTKAYGDALHPTEKWDEWERYGISHFLKDDRHLKNISSNTKILLRPHNAHEAYQFYLKRLEQKEGLKIDRSTFTSLQVGDTILSHHKMVYDSLQKDYRVEVLDSSYQYTKLTVLHPKDTVITYHQTTL
jgi:4-amino-4-deoxy-L-arabinose transferase-like glycosyltransferase